jgi:alpha-beta hydrolase superfamily lysophospholipase
MNLTAHDLTAEDGTRLRLWEDAPSAADSSPSESDPSAGESPDDSPAEAVVFVHGAITHSRALFAPPVEDEAGRADDSYSWLRATAETGRTAYALDVRGYGDSDLPPENDPPVRAGEAAADVAAAVEFADERHDAVHLVGVSWGTMTTGRFLAEETGAPPVASYTQCAPVYDPPYEFAEVVSAFDLDSDLGAHYAEDRETVAERKDADANPRLFEAVWTAMVESRQGEAADREDAYAAQTGALADVRACCEGNPPYDPGEIGAPTLVVRGTDDETSRRSDAVALYDGLGSDGDRREYAELAGADHYAMHGERRRALYDLVAAWFDRNA